MTTIKDVAKKAGVSVSTVSYALSGVRPISDETRQRILRAIEELNYHPNLLARGLINKRTRIIALLYPTLSPSALDESAIEFFASVTNVTFEYDYGLLLFTHPLGEQEIKRFINQGLVDGVILMEVQRQDPRVALMKQVGYPFSLIGHSESNEGVSFVDMDFYTAMRLAVQHLAKLKHREMVFLPTIQDINHAQHNYIFESIRGFNDAARELGLQGWTCGCDATFEGSYRVMNEALEKHPGISAVITGSELIFNGVTKALQDKGLRVPRDFSVVGQISDRSAEKYTPKVTNISIPAMEMGRLGAEALIKQLEDEKFPPQQVMLPPQFIVRQSTARYKERG
jgi:DNA-binding LacI/PurR family transcriptional regulator